MMLSTSAFLKPIIDRVDQGKIDHRSKTQRAKNLEFSHCLSVVRSLYQKVYIKNNCRSPIHDLVHHPIIYQQYNAMKDMQYKQYRAMPFDYLDGECFLCSDSIVVCTYGS